MDGLILEQDNILYPIEIKKSGTPKKDAIKHFRVLEIKGKPVGRKTPGAYHVLLESFMCKMIQTYNSLCPLIEPDVQ